MARDLSRLRRSVGRFVAKKGSLRSPRGRLVPSLITFMKMTRDHFKYMVSIYTRFDCLFFFSYADLTHDCNNLLLIRYSANYSKNFYKFKTFGLIKRL